MDNFRIKKPMTIMLIIVGILFGSIFAYQIFKAKMIKKYLSKNSVKIVTVSTTEAKTQNWQPTILATGSLRATLGVDITTELAGMVREIYFKPGDRIKKGTPILKLNDNTEQAQLQVAQAAAQLAQITYVRDKAQFDIKAVSQATLDSDDANLKSQLAQVAQQQSLLAKKNIQAPFSGRLGVCLVYPGQYLNPGDKIATLQQLDPIYVDFFVPQQELVRLKTGQSIKLKIDSYPKEVFSGKITTIDPKVEVSTRNVRVEATLSNPKELLLPGMFGQVEIDTGLVNRYITVPQNAISFNSYGEIVYLVQEAGKDKNGKPSYIAKQSFVEVGDTRDNQIAVLKGIKEGDQVVTSGQLKLKNGSPVTINNDLDDKVSTNAIDQSEESNQ
jgi:membrane fusion protein, multidrug efflux system